jgi:toxin HigB-1
MFLSFKDKKTSSFYRGERVAVCSGIERSAGRKLDQLDAAMSVQDLSRPGNQLEKLKGNRLGQWSIRINDQWRICFEWPSGGLGPQNIEIVDYH